MTSSPATSFPSSSDYVVAVRYPKKFLLDPVLREGRPRMAHNRPLMLSGGFARVFPWEGGHYALRCWTASPGDAHRIYAEEVRSYLSERAPGYFPQHHFEPEGIIINSARWPTLRMEWVEAPSLKEFLRDCLNQAPQIKELREQFVKMVSLFHAHQIAHRDLQPNNIKIRMTNRGPCILLLDLDTVYVPALCGIGRGSAGLPDYQHPLRAGNPRAEAYDDYFSELSLYLTLVALEQFPALWDQYRVGERDDQLLFCAADYLKPDQSAVFNQLAGLGGTITALTEALVAFCKAGALNDLKPLEEVLARLPATGLRTRSRLEAKLTGGVILTPVLPRPIGPSTQPTRTLLLERLGSRKSPEPSRFVSPTAGASLPLFAARPLKGSSIFNRFGMNGQAAPKSQTAKRRMSWSLVFLFAADVFGPVLMIVQFLMPDPSAASATAFRLGTAICVSLIPALWIKGCYDES